MKKVSLLNFFKLKNLKKNLILFLFIGIFLLGNLFLKPINLKLDLSKNQAYSISSSTKKILKNLEKNLEIYFFVSENLPTNFITLKNDVLDFLKEYEKQSKKIIIKVVDPAKDDKNFQLAQEFYIPELQLSQLEQDKFSVSRIYFGLGLKYDGKIESIRQLNNLESLEFNLSTLIYKLSKKNLEKIGLIGETSDLNSFLEVVSNQFETDYPSLDKEIDKNIKTLVIIDKGSKEYKEEELKNLFNYLENSGRAIFLVDKFLIDEASLYISSSKTDWNKIFKDYGLTIENNLVLSLNSQLVSFGSNDFQFLSPYPYWLKTNQFAKNSSYFSNVSVLTFPWVSSIKINEKKNYQYEKLVYSTDKSWQVKDNIKLDPSSIIEPQKFSQYLLVTKVNFKNKGAILLIPSSRFLSDKFLNRDEENLKFVLNVLYDFTSQGVLSGIKQRTVNIYQLGYFVNSLEKEIFKYASIILLPGLFLLIGIVKVLKGNR